MEIPNLSERQVTRINLVAVSVRRCVLVRHCTARLQYSPNLLCTINTDFWKFVSSAAKVLEEIILQTFSISF